MKIWYFSAYDQPKGQSLRTWDFSAELVRRGHSVTMFTNGYCHFTHKERLRDDERWRVEIIDNVRVVWLKTRPYVGNGLDRGLNMLDNARRALQSSAALGDQPDVVLGPSVPLLTGWAAARVAERYRTPFVFEVRDVWPAALVDIGGIRKCSLTYALFRCLEKSLYHKAIRISSALPYIGEHVSNSGGDPQKIVFIPNGIDLAAYSKLDAYDGGAGRPLTAMYVGGFGLDHDVPTIIEAAKILQDENDDRIRFILYGGGVRRTQCEGQARSYNLRNLELHPPISKSMLPVVQQNADVLLASITDSKIFRFGLNLNKLCSYFASARPVLLSGNPPNDPVKDSGGGISVRAEDPRAMVDALRRFVNMSSSERMHLGQLGRRYAEESLSMGALGKRMEDMLKAAILDYSHMC